MRCAWNTYINLLPLWMREYVDKHGRDILLELRLRLGLLPELVTSNGSMWMQRNTSYDDLNFCINAASRYSPWASRTIEHCYITAPGGHRVGIFGNAIIKNNTMTGVSTPSSVCIRVSRDFHGIAAGLSKLSGSVLIIGKPGSGKTTLLRDFVRLRSNSNYGSVCVIDEKYEIFPKVGEKFCFDVGKHTDVLSGCNKECGIDAALRNMCPTTIVIDELTSAADCSALIHAGWCGVSLIATAHAANIDDLKLRPIYKQLMESKIFDTIVTIQEDRSWTFERMIE